MGKAHNLLIERSVPCAEVPRNGGSPPSPRVTRSGSLRPRLRCWAGSRQGRVPPRSQRRALSPTRRSRVGLVGEASGPGEGSCGWVTRGTGHCGVPSCQASVRKTPGPACTGLDRNSSPCLAVSGVPARPVCKTEGREVMVYKFWSTKVWYRGSEGCEPFWLTVRGLPFCKRFLWRLGQRAMKVPAHEGMRPGTG